MKTSNKTMVSTNESSNRVNNNITQAAKDFADALEIKTGDRVLSKHYGAMATVLGREYDHRRKVWYYRVEFDTPQKGMDGTERKVTEFKRYGITKNYYPQDTAEIVGNAIYYAEELQADYWGTDSKPRTIFDCEIFKPTDRRPLWILVADIFSSPKEMTLQQVAEYLARRYRESIALPEPPAEITLEDSGEITDEDEKANIDPRFTLNRYNISPASKYINDLGTMCANIRPEDDPEGERLGYCRYMTKKPGGEWTENRCMSWHSLEYSLYVFNAREMTFAESVEDRDGMEKPTDMYALAANIDRLLKRIASRGTAFAEVLSYIECYPDMGREYLNAMQCRDSLDHFRRWCAARQKHLRRKSA